MKDNALDIQRYLIAGFIQDWGFNEYSHIINDNMFGRYANAAKYMRENWDSPTPDLYLQLWEDFWEVMKRYSSSWKLYAEKYIKELYIEYRKQKLWDKYSDDDNLEETKKMLNTIDEKSTWVSRRAWINQILINVEWIVEEHIQKWQIGYKTWIKTLDKYVEWLIKWKVYRLSAYSNTWKSKLSYFICNNVLKHWAKVLYFSVEVTKEECALNLLSNWYNVDYYELLHGKRIIDFSKYAEQKIEIYDDARTISDIAYIIKAKKPDVVFIDYVQLVWWEWDNEYTVLNAYSRKIKQLAISEKCAIFDLSQVSNDQFKYKNWWIVPAKWSGELVASSDVSLVMEREENSQFLKLYVAKNRYWPRWAAIQLEPDMSKCNFIDLWEI
jgi:predicted ATP-dependent serine protease